MKKVILKSMLLFVAILFAGIAQAQTVTGTVTEANGPLPGANVIVKGTSNGATTDFDGNYTLNNVPSDATLIFSYVGFTTQEVAVGGRTNISITLEADNALEEVVLIGYGATTIKDATGSVDNVGAEDFIQGVIQSPEQLIQGKTAGVQISEGSGEPGSGINIRIRGNGTLRSGTTPLFVVDGVPLAGGGSAGVGVAGVGSAGGGNPLSFLNPNDIENISVLKDASATAIYGSRGANGVVIVQTKGGRGATGKGRWELNTSVSTATPANEYDLLGREGFLAAIEAVGNNPAPQAQGGLDGGFDTDWQDFYTRRAFSRQTDLSYSKSYTGGNLRASLGYGNQEGVVLTSEFERLSGRLNITQKFFNDKLTITGTGALTRVNSSRPPLDGTAGSLGDFIGASITANPTLTTDPNTQFPGGRLNPANLIANYTGTSQSDRVLANISAEYKITEDLSAKVSYGYDETMAESIAVFGPNVLALNGVSNLGRGAFAFNQNTNQLLTGTLNYKKDFGNAKLDVVAGYEYQEFRNQGIQGDAAGFSGNLSEVGAGLFDQYDILEGAIGRDFVSTGFGNDGNFFSSINFGDTENPFSINNPIEGSFEQLTQAFAAFNFDNTDEIQSFFARANLTLNEKFIFTGTFRADGSTRFGNNNRYGFFPSGAFAWRLDQEDFVGDNISTLKLRLSAGQVGSQDGLGHGEFLQRERPGGVGIDNDFNIFAGGDPNTFITGQFNDDLKWETTTDFNIGLDYGFNDDRLNGSINVYRRETRDLLLRRQVAAPSIGGGTIFSNLEDGVILNQGVEFSVNYDFINTDDWGFNANFNIAYNFNEVQDFSGFIPTGPIRGNGLTNAFAQQIEAGQPTGSFFLAEFTGFDADGNPTYFDFDGNGVGDPDADKFFVGENSLPDVTAGLSLNARYKNFDISTFFNGQFGFSVYNATDTAFFTRSALLIGNNVPASVAASDENAASTIAVSSRFLERGDFVRLTNATIGYNHQLSGEGFFDSLRFTLTGQNLFLITDYSGLDPELSANTGQLNDSAIPSEGIDYASFPRPRTFTLGVNAKF